MFWTTNATSLPRTFLRTTVRLKLIITQAFDRNGVLTNWCVILVDLTTYVTKFQWDAAKYPVKQPLRNISEIIVKQVTQVDSDLKSKTQQYNMLKQQLQALERKQT